MTTRATSTRPTGAPEPTDHLARPRRAALTVLLPPSESKATGGTGAGWEPDDGTFGPALAEHRQRLVEVLAATGGGDARLLGVTGPHLDRARVANVTLAGSPTLPAWRRYTGVVWDHLAPATLTAAQRRSLVVVSGLHGLVRGDDPVPDYRLRMGVTLRWPGGSTGRLSSWWRPVLGEALHAATSRRILVDLLPHEHRAAFDHGRVDRGPFGRATFGPGTFDPAAAEGRGRDADEGVSADRATTPDRGPSARNRLVLVDLVERSGGRPGGHAAKAAKGRLARHLLTSDLPVDAALATWEDDRFVPDAVWHTGLRGRMGR